MHEMLKFRLAAAILALGNLAVLWEWWRFFILYL